jgi:hypothetical protein
MLFQSLKLAHLFRRGSTFPLSQLWIVCSCGGFGQMWANSLSFNYYTQTPSITAMPKFGNFANENLNTLGLATINLCLLAAELKNQNKNQLLDACSRLRSLSKGNYHVHNGHKCYKLTDSTALSNCLDMHLRLTDMAQPGLLPLKRELQLECITQFK